MTIKRSYTDWKQKKTKEKNQQAVLTILKDGPKQFKELYENVEFSEPTLSRILYELTKYGLIELIIDADKCRVYCLYKKDNSEIDKIIEEIEEIRHWKASMEEKMRLETDIWGQNLAESKISKHFDNIYDTIITS